MDSSSFLYRWRSPSHDSTSSQRSGAHSFQPTRATPSMFTFYPSLPLYSQGSQQGPVMRKPIFNPFDAETDEEFGGWVDQLKGKIIHALKPEDAAREESFRKLQEQLSELRTKERAFSEEVSFIKESKGKQREKRDIDMSPSYDAEEQEIPFENSYGNDISLTKEYPEAEYIEKENVDIRNGIFDPARNGDGDMEDSSSPISYGDNEDENASNQWNSYSQSETLNRHTRIGENGLYNEILSSKETITLSSDEEENIDNDDGSVKTEEYIDDDDDGEEGQFIFDIDGDHMSLVSADDKDEGEPSDVPTIELETQNGEYQKEEAGNTPMTPEFRNVEFGSSPLTPITPIHDEDKDVQMSPTTHYLRSREKGVRDYIQQFENIGAVQGEKSNEMPLHEASKGLSKSSRTPSKRRRKRADDDFVSNNAEASDGSDQDINPNVTEGYNLRHKITADNQGAKASNNEMPEPLSKPSRGSPKRRREKPDGNQSFVPSDREGSDHDMNAYGPENEHYNLRHKTTAAGQETSTSEALEHPRGSPKRHRKNRNDDQISAAENINEASEGLDRDVDASVEQPHRPDRRRKTITTELNTISSEVVEQSPKRSRKPNRKILESDLSVTSKNNEKNKGLENGFTNGILQESTIGKASQETPKRRQSTSKRQRKTQNDEQFPASDSENTNEIANHAGILEEPAVIEADKSTSRHRRKSHHKAANTDKTFVPEDEKINESSDQEENSKTTKRVKRPKSDLHNSSKKTKANKALSPKAKDSAESNEEPSVLDKVANDSTKRHRGRPRKNASKTGEKTSSKVTTPSRSRQSRLNNSALAKTPEVNHFDKTQTLEPPTLKAIDDNHNYGNDGENYNEETNPNFDLEALLRNHDCTPDAHESLMNLLPPETHEKLKEFFSSHDHRGHSPTSETSAPLEDSSQPYESDHHETDDNDHHKESNDNLSPNPDNSGNNHAEKSSRRSRNKITSNYYLRSKCPLRSLILATKEGRQYYVGKSCLIEAPQGSAVKRRREGTSASQEENQDQDEIIPEMAEAVDLQAEVVPEHILENHEITPNTEVLFTEHAPVDFLRSAKKVRLSPRKSSRLLEANKNTAATKDVEIAEGSAPPSPSTRHGIMYENLGEDDTEV